MNFKPELLAKVLAGQKTQTRRPVKPGQYSFRAPGGIAVKTSDGREHSYPLSLIMSEKGRYVYELFKDYAACPGRGKLQQGRIRILNIRREDVRNISHEDALAEGFENELGFWQVWTGFYDKPGVRIMDNLWSRIEGGDMDDLIRIAKLKLADRPAHLYDAWALTFEVTHEAP